MAALVRSHKVRGNGVSKLKLLQKISNLKNHLNGETGKQNSRQKEEKIGKIDTIE
ncbi:hypothetical protein EV294_1021037 [Paenibacillus sp. BK033]|nr:hypothetical protein EV294_1021037 [Paenibacillus sp. BK033]